MPIQQLAGLRTGTNEPPPSFFADCIRAGVRISFGSDAHALYEIGEFHPHLALLADIGFDGDLTDILLCLAIRSA